MILQLFKRRRWLLPLLGALTFGLMAPQVLADREGRGDGRGYQQGYDRHQNQYYGKHYGKRFKHRKHARHHRHHRHYRYAPRRARVVEQYYYQPPRHYYREHRSSRAHISVTLPLGTIVHGLPGGYVSFNLGGDPYYYHGGNYYRSYQRGYRVIAPPSGHRW
ncbi:DUF6515 family protein [uncultured Oceanisphaera sp.]|uniref:DUF6515 family protein n=1 Tax=uncultured Oceanisphaera sp. TaxID=353858 RepID=UPI0026064FF7|nr:DUF6515 family protein [uncultured Oceanisphaera sp.]